MFLISRKAQTWSLDAMISVMVFIIGLVILLYFLFFSSSSGILEQLKTESEIIPLKITSAKSDTQIDSLAFIIDGKVDSARLKQLAEMNYTQLKAKMGVKNEFCIYFEDKDGNLVNISAEIGKSNVMGIGNPEFSISEYSCG